MEAAPYNKNVMDKPSGEQVVSFGEDEWRGGRRCWERGRWA